MEKFDALSIPFYKFAASQELQDIVYKDIANLKYDAATDITNGYVYSNYYHKELYQWFNECITQVSKIYYNDTTKFPIVDCWVNKYTAVNKLNKHFHLNSIICGLYYVTTHDSGNTIFEYINPWINHKHAITINKEESPPQLVTDIKPKSGQLILFPSNIVHHMKPYKDIKNIRYTIAFNTFPSGVLGSHRTGRLCVQALSVEEQYNLGKFF